MRPKVLKIGDTDSSGVLLRFEMPFRVEEIGVGQRVLPSQVGRPRRAVGGERHVAVWDDLQQIAGPQHRRDCQLRHFLEPARRRLLPVEQERHRQTRRLAIEAPIGEAAAGV